MLIEHVVLTGPNVSIHLLRISASVLLTPAPDYPIKELNDMHTNHIESTNLIYGLVDYGEGVRVVILHRSDAEEIYAALKAARKASTWGEFRELCPHEYVELVHEHFRFEEEQLPKDADPFSHDQIPGVDYDWPRYASGLYGEGLPEELVTEFGNHYSTVLDGIFIHFNPEDLIEIRKQLVDKGFTLERDDETAKHAVGCGDMNLG